LDRCGRIAAELQPTIPKSDGLLGAAPLPLPIGVDCSITITGIPNCRAMPHTAMYKRLLARSNRFQRSAVGLLISVCATAAWAQASAPGSQTASSSGLQYTELKAGTGPKPQATDVVRVHYRGTFPDGREFDSSYSRGQPAEFPLNRVIRCWTEGVQRMQVGAKAKLVCPPAIAYGERGAGGVIPPNATLHFEVELLGIAGR
jgi:FKBP-type peptidyl-prolyl cis-trans isomerase FkpA